MYFFGEFMKKHSFFSLLTLPVLFNLFFSCATTIHVTVDRPAEVDLGSARSIAIEPIDISKNLNRTEAAYARDIVNYLEYNIENALISRGYYKIIGTSDRRTPADIYLEGEITLLDITDEKNTEKIKNPNYGKNTSGGSKSTYEPEYLTEITYRRRVQFIYTYQYVDGYTNQVIKKREICKDTSSSKVAEIKMLPEPYDMVNDYLYYAVAQIAKEILPYSVSKSLTLLEVKKDDDMEYAAKLAEKGYYDESYNKYVEIYNARNYFEAYYNAAIILEAKGDYYGARDMMKQLYLQTLDNRAHRALTDIQAEIEYQYQLQQQNNKRN